MHVSIPFIAGQWSLRCFNPATHDAGAGSQSPSLRGSGRFSPRDALRQRHRLWCLNPLHCGAVVASRRTPRSPTPPVASQSPSLRGSGRFTPTTPATAPTPRPSQSPSLRGSGRFRLRTAAARRRPRVSIPFIAGQWSLPRTAICAARTRPCLNPLHCGAVVASRRRTPMSRSRSRRLNPLHCGAVVASKTCPTPRSAGSSSVSIPFIAGQWSLQKNREPRAPDYCVSQSPSLRGSGRFEDRRRKEENKTNGLNPLHCGAVVASGRLA